MHLGDGLGLGLESVLRPVEGSKTPGLTITRGDIRELEIVSKKSKKPFIEKNFLNEIRINTLLNFLVSLGSELNGC